jgi:hypothetical protein
VIVSLGRIFSDVKVHLDARYSILPLQTVHTTLPTHISSIHYYHILLTINAIYELSPFRIPHLHLRIHIPFSIHESIGRPRSSLGPFSLGPGPRPPATCYTCEACGGHGACCAAGCVLCPGY